MKPQDNKSNCLLCKAAARLTREHKIKASILKYFNNIENHDPQKKLKFFDGSNDGGEFSNIKNARILRPKKNICLECNGKRSIEADSCFDHFVISTHQSQDTLFGLANLEGPTSVEIDQSISNLKSNLINKIDDSDWTFFTLFVNAKYLVSRRIPVEILQSDQRLIKKFVAKHSVCYVDRIGLAIPDFLRDIFLKEQQLDRLQAYCELLPKSFAHGYMNSAVRFPPGQTEYSIIFSNFSIRVVIDQDCRN